MTDDPRLTPLAAALPASVPFVGPEAQERARGAPFIARLGANESVFGPSPKAITAMKAAASDVWKYADPESHDLRAALATHHGIAPEHIMIAEGIDTLLGLLVRLLVGPGDTVVTSAGAYPTFNYHVAGFGGILHQIAYTGDFEDPDHLTTKAREVRAKLIYLANPDNPMGSVHDAKTIRRMLKSVPDHALLVLDEAYIELAPDDTAAKIDPTDTRVIRMRTFSKGYGMAGARIAYAIAEKELVTAFDKVRNHFGVNRTAQIGALAALRDQDYLNAVRGWVAEARVRIAEIAADNGLSVVPSQTNFVAVDCGRDGDFARAVLKSLVGQGIFVRMPGVAPMDRCIRVSAGRPQDLAAFADALPKALEEAGASA